MPLGQTVLIAFETLIRTGPACMVDAERRSMAYMTESIDMLIPTRCEQQHVWLNNCDVPNTVQIMPAPSLDADTNPDLDLHV